jgi:hypothetical protein
MKLKIFGLAGLGLALFACPAVAHHSFAMFDNSVTNTLDGNIEGFEYINPHAWVHLAVPNEAGGTATWSFEMGSVAQLNRDGWDRDTIAIGDEVRVGFHPLKDGSNGGQFRFLRFGDGRLICQAGAGAGNSCNPDDFREAAEAE